MPYRRKNVSMWYMQGVMKSYREWDAFIARIKAREEAEKKKGKKK